MTVTRQLVADKIAEYLHRRTTLAQLVDWAKNALMEGEFDESDIASVSKVVSRLGVADVRAFAMWEDCEEILAQSGFSTRIEIITA